MKSPAYVLHATHSATDAQAIRMHGFRVQSGRAVVSTDLIFACELVSDPNKRVWSRSQTPIQEGERGRILVLRIPQELTVKYAMKTNIKIDGQTKEIFGYANRYRYSRRQLAIYDRTCETPEVNISPQDVQMELICSDELAEEIYNLKVRVQKLELIDAEAFAHRITEIINADRRNNFANHCDINEIMRILVLLTIETTWVNLVRSLAVDVKLAQGYILHDIDNGQIKDIVDKRALRLKLYKYKAISEQNVLLQERDRLNNYLQKHISNLLWDLENFPKNSRINNFHQLLEALQKIIERSPNYLRFKKRFFGRFRANG